MFPFAEAKIVKIGSINTVITVAISHPGINLSVFYPFIQQLPKHTGMVPSHHDHVHFQQHDHVHMLELTGH